MERAVDVRWAFSTKAQSAYGTALADTDLTLSHEFEGPDIAEVTPDVIDDKEFIKGVEWATKQEVLKWDVKLARKTDLTSLLAGWVGAFGLGSVVTTQPDPTNAPNTYDHTCKFNTASLQNPVTSIVEEIGSSIKRKLRDMAVEEFTISGEGHGRLKLEMSLVGSGYWENSTLTMPAISDGGSYLRMRDLNFKIGPAGSEIDVSKRLKSFSWKVNNNLQLDSGYYPGSGLYRGRCLYGAREQELSFVLYVEGDQELQDLINNSQLKCIITATGDTIEGTYKHELTITFPKLSYRAVPIETDGPFLAYNIECNVLYDDATGVPVEMKVRNNQPSYLV